MKINKREKTLLFEMCIRDSRKVLFWRKLIKLLYGISNISFSNIFN